jgi:hypothetical protein
MWQLTWQDRGHIHKDLNLEIKLGNEKKTKERLN